MSIQQKVKHELKAVVLLFYNLLSALNHHLGTGGLARVFITPKNDSHID